MVTGSLEGLTLHVADLERSLEFYATVPGAQILVHRPGVFAMVQIGKARLGLLARAQSLGFHLEIETEDLEAMYAQLQEAGIEPKTPPTKKPWGGVDFTVADPDGNIVEFGEAHG
jgi:catechol 2,3-dioxygenase-like lactoylglutathione lyase family enzyme